MKGIATHLTAAAVKEVADKKIAIVTARWNQEITHALRDATLARLTALGWAEDSLVQLEVPGAIELSLGTRWLLEKSEHEAVIAIGCVIQGDTPHFDYVCQSVTMGLTQLSLTSGRPIVFGVLTVNTIEQAKERSTGKRHKGHEFADTAAEMLLARHSLYPERKKGIGF